MQAPPQYTIYMQYVYCIRKMVLGVGRNVYRINNMWGSNDLGRLLFAQLCKLIRIDIMCRGQIGYKGLNITRFYGVYPLR